MKVRFSVEDGMPNKDWWTEEEVASVGAELTEFIKQKWMVLDTANSAFHPDLGGTILAFGGRKWKLKAAQTEDGRKAEQNAEHTKIMEERKKAHAAYLKSQQRAAGSKGGQKGTKQTPVAMTKNPPATMQQDPPKKRARDDKADDKKTKKPKKK